MNRTIKRFVCGSRIHPHNKHSSPRPFASAAVPIGYDADSNAFSKAANDASIANLKNSSNKKQLTINSLANHQSSFTLANRFHPLMMTTAAAVTDHPVLRALQRFRAKQIPASSLMRAVVEFDRWVVPVSAESAAAAAAGLPVPSVMMSQEPSGVTRLFLFTSPEAWNTFISVVGGPRPDQQFLTKDGAFIVGLPIDEVNWIVIDPASQHEFSYTHEQIPMLRRTAKVLEVEEALELLRFNPEAATGRVELVRDFPDYRVVVQKLGEESRICMAPDDRGRTLAAVFTFDDAAETFLHDAAPTVTEGELAIMAVNGPGLFQTLSQMNIEGLVFNCRGPTTTIAFAAEFARLMAGR